MATTMAEPHSVVTPPRPPFNDVPAVVDGMRGSLRRVMANRALSIALLVALGLGVIAVVFDSRPTYTSRARIVPQRQTQMPQLAGLAGQLGVNLPMEAPDESPAFYAELVTTRTILHAVAKHSFQVRASEPQRPLSEILRVRDDNAAVVREKVYEKLRRQVTAQTVPRSGTVEIFVTARHPNLAWQLNRAIISEISEFNIRSRQTRAAAERRFAERRVDEVAQALRASEERAAQFLSQNRAYSQSPQLRFQYERLSRDVTLQQQLYTTLVQALERAKLDEVRNTPVITVVESASFPALKDESDLVLKLVLLAMLFFGGVVLLGYAMNIFGPRRGTPPVSA